MGFFESFSAPFMMSVALWPLVSFIVTVPVLAMLYHRDNRLGFGAALSGVRDGAVSDRPAVLHAVSDAGRSRSVLRHPPSASAAQSAAVHR